MKRGSTERHPDYEKCWNCGKPLRAQQRKFCTPECTREYREYHGLSPMEQPTPADPGEGEIRFETVEPAAPVHAACSSTATPVEDPKPMTPIQIAVAELETAARLEAEAKASLDATEDAVMKGHMTRGDLKDAYENWLIVLGNKQRAEMALARAHCAAA